MRLQTNLALALLLLATTPGATAQAIGPRGAPQPNLTSNVDRPLRYRPEAADFVIDDGAEFFNRPLYGRNTAFRVDGGDKPEFVLYLPGRGGNLRLAMKNAVTAKWLHDAALITTRYRPGELIYEIRDPLLGAQSLLRVEVLALERTDGLVARLLLTGANAPTVDIVAAYGGVSGERGVRDGDIGTEAVPISEWFQLRPEFCADNVVAVRGNTFELSSPVARIAGVMPAGAVVAAGDARDWSSAAKLLASAASGAARAPVTDVDAVPVAVARFALAANRPAYFALQRIGGAASAPELGTYRDVTASRAASGAGSGTAAGTGAARADDFAALYGTKELPRVFAAAEAHFTSLREQIVVESPDPFINAAVGALNVAADAVWDEPQQAVMHGAIAWRARLLGWRGPYAMDALGWHDRARKHFEYWAGRQNTGAIPATLPPAEEATNLARNPAALHSNGDLSNSHYDMNLVYVEALFRHLLWTGDRDFARAMWPVIERHLAWERRLFRRELGPQQLPLYEAYAAIWASDDLGYHGGGVAHASAYNYWHNTMAARVAALIGADGAPYEREAALIRKAMAEFLWLPEQGMFAEFRDTLGLQRAHPAAALWTFYHALDAQGLVDTKQSWQMTRYVDDALPHLPVQGRGVPDGPFDVIATTSWMPYTWSINNVVMGENVHAALGFWQAGRRDEAFRIFKSALLASMYMGIAPGNVGSMNYLDVYRRESQRDFADGAGVTARALVEGLFGVRPDALAGTIDLQPGWPDAWTETSLRTPDVTFGYFIKDDVARYAFESRLRGIRGARLRLRVTRERVAQVRANERALPANVSTDALGRRWLVVEFPLEKYNEVVVRCAGAAQPESRADLDAAAGVPARAIESPDAIPARIDATTKFTTLDLTPHFNARVTEIFAPGKYRSPRSPGVSLAMPAQGIGAWAGHVNAKASIDDSGLRRASSLGGGHITLPNGVPLVTPGEGTAPNIVFTSQWDNYPRSVSVPLAGHARHVYALMAGSTNHMQSRFDNGELEVAYADGTLETFKLHNPTSWWPIDQDYFIDDYQFRRPGPIPPRVDLATGDIRMPDAVTFKGRGGVVPGGAATVLDFALDPRKSLRSLTVRALANEVVIGLMAVTLVAP